MRRNITLFILLLLFGPATLAGGDNAALVVEDAWIAEAPPVSKVMVAYLTLKNTGTRDIEIISAKSDTFSSIEFHETSYEDGMARMSRHPSLKVAANTALQLTRGGKHLMLFNPKKSLKTGDTVELTFTLKDASNVTINVAVKKMQY